MFEDGSFVLVIFGCLVMTAWAVFFVLTEKPRARNEQISTRYRISKEIQDELQQNMAWWDREFAKLERATYRAVPFDITEHEGHEIVQEMSFTGPVAEWCAECPPAYVPRLHDPKPPTTAELRDLEQPYDAENNYRAERQKMLVAARRWSGWVRPPASSFSQGGYVPPRAAWPPAYSPRPDAYERVYA